MATVVIKFNILSDYMGLTNTTPALNKSMGKDIIRMHTAEIAGQKQMVYFVVRKVTLTLEATSHNQWVAPSDLNKSMRKDITRMRTAKRAGQKTIGPHLGSAGDLNCQNHVTQPMDR